MSNYSDNEINIEKVGEQHSRFIYSLMNNSILMEIFHDKQTSIEEWENAIEIWDNDEDENDYVIISRHDGKMIGWIGINGLISKENVEKGLS